jgi:hypothetical protein
MITHHWLDISNHECLIESDTPHVDRAVDAVRRVVATAPGSAVTAGGRHRRDAA